VTPPQRVFMPEDRSRELFGQWDAPIVSLTPLCSPARPLPPVCVVQPHESNSLSPSLLNLAVWSRFLVSQCVIRYRHLADSGNKALGI
ncbi:hypothetical protein BaRGS_00030652, partial [Batillaria attramentaria]